MSTTRRSIGRAEACANIALAKYWGKSDRGDNLTAVPSLSLTLDALRTRTEVTFDDTLSEDGLIVGDEVVHGRPLARVSEMLDRMRAASGEKRRAQVKSLNNFPTAAGLASSASGFAALSLATSDALALDLSPSRLSSLARKSSASAARSLFAGFVLLGAESDEAEGMFPEDHWDVAMLVAVVASGPKSVGSTGGMVHTKETSPYYSAWESVAPEVFSRVKLGVTTRDFSLVAEAMEHSTRLMHATMMTSEPPVLYLQGTTVDLMHRVAQAREQGLDAAYTMDAGPNVKVLTRRDSVARVQELLASHPGVQRVIVCRPGPAACTLSLEGELDQAARSDSKTLPPFGSAAGVLP